MKIEELAQAIEAQQRVGYIRRHGDRHPELVDMACRVTIKPGKKYTKIDVGRSGKYMVVNATGEIFGIKAYGVIHRGHQYGTLDTATEWDWSDYVARRATISRR